jgi:hypothetical protein
MKQIAYSPKQFMRCFTYTDFLADKTLMPYANRRAATVAAWKAVEALTVFAHPTKTHVIKGKSAHTLPTIESLLVSRVLARNIKINYSMRKQSRSSIMSGLIAVLKEGVPYQIYRVDVKNFFESIDRNALLRQLLTDGRCSMQTISLLEQHFRQLDTQGVTGLPRGIGLSSTLADFVMAPFDARVNAHEDVFYCARFVDDVIVVCTPDASRADIQELLESSLPKPLQLHGAGEKFTYCKVPRAVASGGNESEFGLNYLGYKMMISSQLSEIDVVLGIARRRVRIDISEDKVMKIRSRLITSFTNFVASPRAHADFVLLKKRVQALTGNYVIRDPISKLQIKTGIYFSYVEKNTFAECPLIRLDALLRGLLFSPKHKLSLRVQGSLTDARRRELMGHSFNHGFRSIVTYNLSHQDLAQVKRAWVR